MNNFLVGWQPDFRTPDCARSALNLVRGSSCHYCNQVTISSHAFEHRP